MFYSLLLSEALVSPWVPCIFLCELSACSVFEPRSLTIKDGNELGCTGKHSSPWPTWWVVSRLLKPPEKASLQSISSAIMTTCLRDGRAQSSLQLCLSPLEAGTPAGALRTTRAGTDFLWCPWINLPVIALLFAPWLFLYLLMCSQHTQRSEYYSWNTLSLAGGWTGATKERQ